MINNDIIRMAREAGFTQPEGETWYEAFPQCIERFAALVAAATKAEEREACAKLCAEDASGRDSGGYYAEIIRDRSNT